MKKVGNRSEIKIYLDFSSSLKSISELTLVNSKSEIKSVKVRKAFVNSTRFLVNEVRLEYIGSNASRIGIYRQSVKRVLKNIQQNKINALHKLLRLYRASVPIDFFKYSPVFILPTPKWETWISRQATVNGFQAKQYSRVYEYDWERRSSEPRILILGVKRQGRLLPKDILNNQYFPTTPIKDYRLPKSLSTFNYEFRSAYIYGGTTLIHDQVYIPFNRRVPIFDTSWPSEFPIKLGKDLHLPRHQKSIELNEAIFVGHSHSWFHFIIEFIPQLNRVPKHQRNLPLVIPADCPRQIIELYNLLGFNNLLQLYAYERVEIEHLYCFFDMKNIHFNDTDSNGYDVVSTRRIISNLISQCRTSSPTSHGEFIFLKRGRNLLRGMANQREFEEVVHGLGFKIVYPEELSFEEQFDLMSQASVVIAESGAALTSVIFSNTRLSVLVLQTPDDDAFWLKFLSNLGHKYFAIKGRTRVQDVLFHDSKFYYDVNVVKQIIIKMVYSRSDN